MMVAGSLSETFVCIFTGTNPLITNRTALLRPSIIILTFFMPIYYPNTFRHDYTQNSLYNNPGQLTIDNTKSFINSTQTQTHTNIH